MGCDESHEVVALACALILSVVVNCTTLWFACHHRVTAPQPEVLGASLLADDEGPAIFERGETAADALHADSSRVDAINLSQEQCLDQEI